LDGDGIEAGRGEMEAVSQVDDYLFALGCKDEFAFRRLTGARIAERVSNAVRRSALDAGIEAYEIEWPMVLTRVS